jgi:polysaccharide pyruvyl transferase WcaK-like protein
VETAYRKYLTAIANAVDAFRKVRRVFVVLAATEALDTRSCAWISERLGGVPGFSSNDYDMYELVGILRACHLMVSSRYHGIVTSMPGLVASAGITMDERIRNLMRERGHGDLLLEVDDPELEGKLMLVLDKLWKERERIAEGIGRNVVRNLQLMARMGVYFEEHVQRRYPEFPLRAGVRSWEEYLPPLSPGLEKLAETYEAVSA